MMKEFLDNSYLFGGNAPFVEDLYEKYLADPASVPDEWRGYFDKLQLMPGSAVKDVAHAPVVDSFAQRAKSGPAKAVVHGDLDRKQVSVIQLVAEYRFRGCRLADLDPLKRQPKPHIAELEPAYYDLGEADMDTVFNTGTLAGSARYFSYSSSTKGALPPKRYELSRNSFIMAAYLCPMGFTSRRAAPL